MLFGSETEGPFSYQLRAVRDPGSDATWVVGEQSSSSSEAVGHPTSLSLSGSNQAREGRLVNALAVRGDEGRDTLR